LILIRIHFIIQLDRLVNVNQMYKRDKIIKIMLILNNNKIKMKLKLIKYR